MSANLSLVVTWYDYSAAREDTADITNTTLGDVASTRFRQLLAAGEAPGSAGRLVASFLAQRRWPGLVRIEYCETPHPHVLGYLAEQWYVDEAGRLLRHAPVHGEESET